MHDPVRAARDWSQAREKGNLWQNGRKEEGEEAELTPEPPFVASWRGDLFFGMTELAKKRNLVCPPLPLTHRNNRGSVHKALLFSSGEQSTLKGDIMRLLCGALHRPLNHHSLLSL